MNPKVGGSSPSPCLKNGDTFTRTSFVCRKWMLLPRTVNISNANFTSKIYIPPKPVFKTWDSKRLALIAQMVRAFGMARRLGVRFPFRAKIFCLKNFDTFTRTSVPVSKTNVVAHAQLKIQNITVLRKYKITPLQWSVYNIILNKFNNFETVFSNSCFVLSYQRNCAQDMF